MIERFTSSIKSEGKVSMNRMIALTGWLSESIAVAILTIGILFVGISQSSFAAPPPPVPVPCDDQDPNTFTCPKVTTCPINTTCMDHPTKTLKCSCQ